MSYELFLLGCLDLHKVWKCFMTFTTFFQISIARMATCSSSTQRVWQSVNGKTFEVFNSMYRSLRAGELLNSFPMALKLFPISTHWLSCQPERLRGPHVIHTTQHPWFGKILSQYGEILNFHKLSIWCLVRPWKAWLLISRVTRQLLQEAHARCYLHLATSKTPRLGNVFGLQKDFYSRNESECPFVLPTVNDSGSCQKVWNKLAIFFLRARFPWNRELIHVQCSMPISFLMAGMTLLCHCQGTSEEIAGSNSSNSEMGDVMLELSEPNNFQHEKLPMYSLLNQSHYWRCLCLMITLENYFWRRN